MTENTADAWFHDYNDIMKELMLRADGLYSDVAFSDDAKKYAIRLQGIVEFHHGFNADVMFRALDFIVDSKNPLYMSDFKDILPENQDDAVSIAINAIMDMIGRVHFDAMCYRGEYNPNHTAFSDYNHVNMSVAMLLRKQNKRISNDWMLDGNYYSPADFIPYSSNYFNDPNITSHILHIYRTIDNLASSPYIADIDRHSIANILSMFNYMDNYMNASNDNNNKYNRILLAVNELLTSKSQGFTDSQLMRITSDYIRLNPYLLDDPVNCFDRVFNDGNVNNRVLPGFIMILRRLYSAGLYRNPTKNDYNVIIDGIMNGYPEEYIRQGLMMNHINDN